MHYLVCNQPILLRRTKPSPLKQQVKGPRVLVSTWAWVLSKKDPHILAIPLGLGKGEGRSNPFAEHDFKTKE